MTYLQAAVLGIVQGLAEFLPISSSGHLALLQYFFGVESDSVLLFTVMMHVGTLVSVFIIYRKDIWALLKELCYTIKDLCTGKGPRINANPMRRMGFMIIVATIPTAFIGLLFEDFFESLYASIVAIAMGLIFTGIILLVAERMGRSDKGPMEMKWRHAIFIGIMQGIAICPGVSRSGSTLFGGLIAGLKREFAVEFAFLISIPSILGSVILEMPKAIAGGADASMIGPIILGVILAMISGIVAIKAMIKVVTGKRLFGFSIYVWLVAAAVLAYAMFAL
ncbi:MAG: undecaprenyl-diphosphate phosphatase [Clostridia bacterium]|nr:undecaprenyl-diphosphate phosphatase [Clostridia bacterium]